MKKENSSGKLILIISISILLLIFFERFFISKQFPTLSGIAVIEWKFLFFKYPIPLPKFGLITLFLMILILTFFIFIPYKKIATGRIWKIQMWSWLKINALLLLLPVCMILGAFLYNLIQDKLPEWLKVILESFGFTFTPTILGTQWETFNGSISTLAGLLIALYFIARYYKRRNPFNK